MAMPDNGPANKKGLAYYVLHKNTLIVTMETFEAQNGQMRLNVVGQQLDWFKEVLAKHKDADHIIVQGHLPIFGTPKSRSSSNLMLEGGTDSEFWKVMKEAGVDLYLCGEFHAVTAAEKDGVWQIVHGSSWGREVVNNQDYLVCKVTPDALQLEMKSFPMEAKGDYMWNLNKDKGPRESVEISKETREKGPTVTGTMSIQKAKDGKKYFKPHGCISIIVFSRGVEKTRPHKRRVYFLNGYAIMTIKLFRCVALTILSSILVQSELSGAETAKDFFAGKMITLNDNGAWSWFMDQRVIVDKDKLIVGSVRAVGAFDTHKSNPNWGNIEVSVYDINTGKVGNTIVHKHLEQDDHDNPAFLTLPDGGYLALYTQHGRERKIYYRISKPGDPLAWGEEKEFATPGRKGAPLRGDNVTYSNLFRMSDGRIYNFFPRRRI